MYARSLVKLRPILGEIERLELLDNLYHLSLMTYLIITSLEVRVSSYLSSTFEEKRVVDSPTFL